MQEKLLKLQVRQRNDFAEFPPNATAALGVVRQKDSIPSQLLPGLENKNGIPKNAVLVAFERKVYALNETEAFE